MAAVSRQAKPWQKNLYEDYGYADNYTDKCFLDKLQNNLHVKTVSMTEAVLQAGKVVQEVCSVVIFVLVFVYLENQVINPTFVFFVSGALTVFGYIIHCWTCQKKKNAAVAVIPSGELHSENHTADFFSDIRNVATFLAFGYGLAPILKTLTDTISTDTIYAMASVMMIVHLVFHNYGASAAVVSSCLSLNSAIFGSVCLASRLPSTFHAFVLLTLSVKCFALFPFLRQKVNPSNMLTVTMIIVSLVGMYSVSYRLTVMLFFLFLFIYIMCPYWFVKAHNYKANIYGPWDEAVIEDCHTN